MVATEKLTRILLVEDREEVKRALKRFMEARLKTPIVCASRAQEGYDIVKSSYEAGEMVRWIILTDIDMKHEKDDWIYSGLDLAEEVCELLDCEEGDVYIILMTGRDIPKSIPGWVDHALQKPLDMPRVCDLLEKFIAKKS